VGLLKFALNGNYKRYYENLKKLSKTVGKNANFMFIDTAISCVFFKSGLQDYINYKFYEKSFKERSTYATIGYQHKFYKIAASTDYAPFFSNKVNFHKNFKEYTKREFYSYDDGFDRFKDFIKKHKEVVRKPITGLGGANVEKIITKNIKDKSKFYEDLKRDNCFLEELVVQNSEWSKLGSKSLNTIRVVTKCINGKADILFAVARIGSGKSIVDNFHQGGVGVKVNIQKGLLEGNTIDKNNYESKTTLTGVVVDGFKIPYWDEVVNMTKEAAKVNDNVNIIGWDIALSDKGPLIIEGNRGPGMDIIQVLYKRGVKPDLEIIKKEILDSRKID
jgi:hypothetical protein